MTLRELTVDLAHPVISGNQDVNVAALAYDSRKVKPGTAFIALRGMKVDGHDFIDTAIKAGAVAIVAETAPPADATIPWVHTSSSRKAMALMAEVFYRRPDRQLILGGITGTNGKTTITYLTHYLLNAAMIRSGLLGTICYDLGQNQIEAATHTTPESLELYKHLSTMVENGCRAAVMEVSSHALDMDRVHGLRIGSAVFTNLTQDHLDYHETMERYFEAKTILFDMVAARPKGRLIINIDDLWGKKLNIKYSSTERVCTYGFGALADFRASNVRYDIMGTTFELTVQGRQFMVRTPLIGDFNVYNTLAALALSRAMGANLREAVMQMKDAPQVPGRLERVGDDTFKFAVYVDYSHTPDALVNALRTLRLLRPRRIITVFGCGGDRDRTKRPAMARAVQEGSDVCIVTTDNPRFEDPAQIFADIVKGFSRKNYVEIPNRAEAIKSAITNAQPGDIVLIAGKGHETYQDIKGVKHDFDDTRVAHGALMSRRTARAEKLMNRIQAEQEEQQAREFEQRAFNNDDPDKSRRKWNE